TLGVQPGSERTDRGFENVGKLVCSERLIVLGIFICRRMTRAGKNVMHLATEDEAPGVVQALARIRGAAGPLCPRGSALGGVSKHLVFGIPTFHVGGGGE